MRMFARLLVGAVLMLAAGSATAGPGVAPACNVCTCADGAIICLPSGPGESVEEQTPCGICTTIGSQFGSRDFVETACEDLPACDHAETPAASPLWLTGGALAMLLIGGTTVRRVRARASS
jgi:hypothetical protein